MFNKKLTLSLLYWVGIAIATSVIMFVLLQYSYVDPRVEYLEFFIGIAKTIFISTAILAVAVETVARIGRKKGS